MSDPVPKPNSSPTPDDFEREWGSSQETTSPENNNNELLIALANQQIDLAKTNIDEYTTKQQEGKNYIKEYQQQLKLLNEEHFFEPVHFDVTFLKTAYKNIKNLIKEPDIAWKESKKETIMHIVATIVVFYVASYIFPYLFGMGIAMFTYYMYNQIKEKSSVLKNVSSISLSKNDLIKRIQKIQQKIKTIEKDLQSQYTIFYAGKETLRNLNKIFIFEDMHFNKTFPINLCKNLIILILKRDKAADEALQQTMCYSLITIVALSAIATLAPFTLGIITGIFIMYMTPTISNQLNNQYGASIEPLTTFITSMSSNLLGEDASLYSLLTGKGSNPETNQEEKEN